MYHIIGYDMTGKKYYLTQECNWVDVYDLRYIGDFESICDILDESFFHNRLSGINGTIVEESIDMLEPA